MARLLQEQFNEEERTRQMTMVTVESDFRMTKVVMQLWLYIRRCS